MGVDQRQLRDRVARSTLRAAPFVRGRWPRPAALVAAGALVAGCADGERVEPVDQNVLGQRGFVSQREVQRQPPGSAARAALAWWRALQLRSASLAWERMSPEARRGLEEFQFAKDVERYFGPWLGLLHPDKVSVDGEGTGAAVTLTGHELRAPGLGVIARTPFKVTLLMARQGTEWRLADSRFYASQLQNIRRATEMAARAAAAP